MRINPIIHIDEVGIGIDNYWQRRLHLSNGGLIVICYAIANLGCHCEISNKRCDNKIC